MWCCLPQDQTSSIQIATINSLTSPQGGHGTGKTGKTGNLVLTFSRQGKHREFGSDTGKKLLTLQKLLQYVFRIKSITS